MTPLKFKAYSHRYRMMFDVTHISFEEPLEGYVDFEGNEGDIWDAIFDGIDFSLVEYAGLNYSDGREAYHGDLFKDEKDNLYRIYKAKGGFALSIPSFPSTLSMNNPWPLQPLADEQTISWFESQAIYVGNIYENPELLEK